MRQNLNGNEILSPTAQWGTGERPETFTQSKKNQCPVPMRCLLYPLGLEGTVIRGNEGKGTNLRRPGAGVPAKLSGREEPWETPVVSEEPARVISSFSPVS